MAKKIQKAAKAPAKKTSKPVAKKATKAVAKKATKPVAKKVAKPVAKKASKPVAKKMVKPAAKKATKPVAKKVTKVAPKKAAKPVAKKVTKVAPKKAAKPVAKKVTKVVAKKVAKPVAKKATKVAPKKAAKPVAKKATKVAPKKAAKPVAKKVTKVAPKKAAKPLAKKVAKPVKKTVKPVAKSVAKPIKKTDKTSNKEVVKPIVVKVAAKRGRKPNKPIVESALSKKPITIDQIIEANKIPIEKSFPQTKREIKATSRPSIDSADMLGTNKPVKAPIIGKTKFTDEELEEFRELINKKLSEAERDYELLKDTLSHRDNNGTDDTSPTFKLLEDGSEVMSKEETTQLAIRQEKFIQNLKNALIRIENKTYGVCRATGKMISKERLRSVPHATLSIEAKREQQ